MISFSLKSDKIIKKDNLSDKKRGAEWIRLSYSDKDKFSDVAKYFETKEEHINEFFDEDERPRILVHKNYILIIFRAPVMKSDYVVTVPIGFIITKTKILTLEKSNTFVLDNVQKNLEENRLKKILSSEPIYFFQHCIKNINEEFTRYVSHVENNAELFNVDISNISEKHTEIIYKSNIVSAFFEQALTANLEVLTELKKLNSNLISEDKKEKFHGLYYDVLQIYDTHKIQRELILNLFNLQSIIQSNKMNNSVKKFSSLAFIIMVPTLISGIYGMNFQQIFLADHPHGFSIMIVIMLSISFVLWWFFKKLDLI